MLTEIKRLLTKKMAKYMVAVLEFFISLQSKSL